MHPSTVTSCTAITQVHLFDVDVPNGPVLMESRSTNAGGELVVFSTAGAGGAASYGPDGSGPGGSGAAGGGGSVGSGFGLDVALGLTTCYDMRFPEMYSLLRSKGANVLLVPSAFTVPTGRAHWEVVASLRVRTVCEHRVWLNRGGSPCVAHLVWRAVFAFVHRIELGQAGAGLSL